MNRKVLLPIGIIFSLIAISSFGTWGNILPLFNNAVSVVSAVEPIYPADVLDLRYWKLTLPVNTDTFPSSPDEVTQTTTPPLSHYTSQYFELNAAKNGVTFYSPAGGSTTSDSGYPRSELRERRDPSNPYTFDEVDCQAKDKEKEACWTSNVGYHIMTIDQAVTQIPVTKPHVVVGQIHDKPDDVTVFRLEGKKLFVDTNRYDSAPDFLLTTTYELGTRFTVAFEVENDVTTFYYNGQKVGQLNEHYDSGYFKAGMYVQSTEGNGAGGKVDIYDLKICHAAAKSGCSQVQPTPPGTQPTNTPTPTPNFSVADIAPINNPDGKVDSLDYQLLVQNFGTSGEVGFHPADIIKNGAVDIFDYSKLLEEYTN